jgi:hypothetical protein
MIRRAQRESATERAGFHQAGAPVPEELCFASCEELEERAKKQLKDGLLKFLRAHTIKYGQ